MSLAFLAVYPVLFLFQAAPDTAPSDLGSDTVQATAPAETLPDRVVPHQERASAEATDPTVLPSGGGGPAESRDTIRIEDVSDETVEWLSFAASAAALLATLYIILQTRKSLELAHNATQEAQEATKQGREANELARRANEHSQDANRLAVDGLRAAIYPHMQQFLEVTTIDGSPFLVLHLQNDGPLPASNLKIFVGSYIRADKLPAHEFVAQHCNPGPWPESLKASSTGEYLVAVSTTHHTLWKSRLLQPLHLDFGAELCVVLLHFADVSGRYYVQRTRYHRNPSAPNPEYQAELDVDTTETDRSYEWTDGPDGSPGIISHGVKEMKVDPKLRDHLAKHSVDWTRLKDQKRRRSISRQD